MTDEQDAGTVANAVEWARRTGGRLFTLRRWLVVVLALPSGLTAIAMWREGSADPLTAGNLLLDWVVRIASIGLVVSVVLVLFGGRSVVAVAKMVMSACCIIISGSVLGTGLLSPPADMEPVMLAGIGTVCGVAVFLVPPRQAISFKPGLGALLLALLALVVPALQFWNSVVFLPGRTEAVVDIEVDVVTVGATDTEWLTELHFTAVNNTDARVVVLRSALVACVAGECASEDVIGARNWIPGSSVFSSSYAIPVPVDERQLEVRVRLDYVRGDRFRVADEFEERELSDCRVALFRIDEESRVKGVAQDAKYLAYLEGFGPRQKTPTAEPEADDTRCGHDCSTFDEREERELAGDEMRPEREGWRVGDLWFTRGPDPGCENVESLSDHYGRVTFNTTYERWLVPPDGS